MPRGSKPGERRGGRKRGTPNKATAEAKSVAEQILGSSEYTASVRQRVKDGTLPAAVECMLWHYAHGKPKDTLTLEGAAPVLVVDELTADDVANIRASRE